MQLTTYLTFSGDCEAAFRFYERCFGGQLGPLFRYAGTPLADQAPADWADKIMHGSISLAGHVLMGADLAPDKYERSRGFSLSLQLDDTGEAERIFNELTVGGRVATPLEQTFWATRFGVVVDRFGIQWIVNCGETSLT